MYKIQALKFILISFFLPFSIHSYSDTNTDASSISKKLHVLTDTFYKNHCAAGMAISVALNNRIIWSKGYGYANLEHEVKVNPSLTKFRVGSISKPFTALALAKLYEQKKLDLDAPIQRYVPNFPRKKWPISVRQLAGHLAGIRHYNHGEYITLQHYDTVAEGLSIFQDDPLIHQPGSAFAYSSYGWNLLSAAVEGASGIDFLRYMSDEIFAKANMPSTTADQMGDIISNRSATYVCPEGSLINAPPTDNSYKWAGGGFLSTTEDMINFGSSHLTLKALSKSTRDMLWASQKTSSGESTGYGIGWRSGDDNKGRAYISHGGSSLGGSALLRMYPEQKIIIAAAINTTMPKGAGELKALSEKMVDVLLTRHSNKSD